MGCNAGNSAIFNGPPPHCLVGTYYSDKLLDHCNGIIQNNVFSGNWAGSLGGGLMSCHGIVRNNTIVGNSAAWGGGLCHCTATVQNCIVWGNTASAGGPDTYRSRTPTSSWWGVPDPGFLDLDGPDDNPNTHEDNDYLLLPDSPCIDAGKNEDWMQDAVDLDGNPRIIDGDGDEVAVVDMGAYQAPFRETTPPEITLLGDPGVTLECGTPYVEPGYTATDNYDGDITANVVVTGGVDPAYPGTYAITYRVSDSGGNTAEPKQRLVYVGDTTPPVITLLGEDLMTLEVGTPYEEPGYTATDACDGDLTADVEVAGSVDHNTVGSYILHYNVSDWEGNAAEEQTRTVNIVESVPFIITEILVPEPDTGIQLTWNSRLGDNYTVQSCLDLPKGAWSDEATVASQGVSTTWTDPDTTSPRRFYRIEIK